ncbi:MAG: hypothetical protein ACPGYV_06515 [Phycisphaeraceae bacterium]
MIGLARNRSFALACCAALSLVVMTGCQRSQTFNTRPAFISPITPADIAYPELAERYNAAIAPIDTLWARTDVDIDWVEIDEQGERNVRSQSGDGKLIFRRPGDVAMTVEKLGKTYLWAGADERRYWLFDQIDSDNKTAYVGDFDKLGGPARLAFPLPVRPDMVPELLGLVPLTIAPEAEQPPVELYNGQYLVELPGKRLLIDPETFRPSRIDLTDRAGFSLLTAKLVGRFPVEVDGFRAVDRPRICESAAVFVAGYESRLTLSIDFATTSKRKIRDLMFDFDRLTAALKPDRVEPLDLE